MNHVLALTLLIAGSAWADDAPNLEKVIDLPVVTHELREGGVPDAEVKQALEATKAKGLTSTETTEALGEAEKAVEAHGPIDNFGAFVQEQLEAGKRGPELAAAIKAEHEARGKGKPDHAGNDGEHGKPDDGTHGKPEVKRPVGEKPAGEKPAGEKPAGGKPEGKAGKAGGGK